MAGFLAGGAIAAVIVSFAFLMTVDWIHPGPYPVPERTRT
jgi:hypothetical protein